MAKTIYRVKGIIKKDSTNDVLSIISNFSNLTFHLDMTKKDRKSEKELQKGNINSLPNDFGTKRHIMCASENFSELQELHTKIQKYLVKDSSDKELF